MYVYVCVHVGLSSSCCRVQHKGAKGRGARIDLWGAQRGMGEVVVMVESYVSVVCALVCVCVCALHAFARMTLLWFP